MLRINPAQTNLFDAKQVSQEDTVKDRLKHLFLIRHGDYDILSKDKGLSEEGYKQADRLGKYLRNTLYPSTDRIAIVCSDVLRAAQTARKIGEYFGLTPEEHAALFAERDLRDAQTQEIDDLFDGLRRKNEIIIAVSHMPIVEGYSRHFLIKELNIQ